MPDRMTKIAVPDTLVDGQRLDQPTFHTIYQAMPAGTRAELIDGVVHMPSPMGRAHGRAQLPVNMWLGQYAENTPGVEVLVGATTILGWRSEPQPDALLRILTEHGGRSHEEQGFISGPPELVVEVCKATRTIDLGAKLADYERAGVLEYVVRTIDPDQIFWFCQAQGVFAEQSLDEDGLYRSAVFPGLWLDPVALLKGDTRQLRAVVDRGCATPEHAGFLARLTTGPRPS
jgi:Uma2 family endonuclease